MRTDYSGQVLDGRYRVTRLLKSGGMGSVYLGTHLHLGKRVAIKFLHTELSSNPDAVKRFHREARAASAIEQSNIITVMDIGESRSREPYIVMEYLEGESLAELLARRGRLTPTAVCGVVEPVLLALSATHENDIVHRDLKPGNIFLAYEKNRPPLVKLIDFGISKFRDTRRELKITRTGTPPMGTLAYMAPEQINGNPEMDGRVDLFALGVILYEMLTGQLPFSGHLADILIKKPKPPSALLDGIPTEIESLILRLISPTPDDRPKSAVAVLAKVRSFPAYADRDTALLAAAAGVTETSVAGGDLGAHVSEGADISEKKMRTPADWEMQTPRRRPKSAKPLLAGIALIAVAGIGTIALLETTIPKGGADASTRTTPENTSPSVDIDPQRETPQHSSAVSAAATKPHLPISECAPNPNPICVFKHDEPGPASGAPPKTPPPGSRPPQSAPKKQPRKRTPTTAAAPADQKTLDPKRPKDVYDEILQDYQRFLRNAGDTSSGK